VIRIIQLAALSILLLFVSCVNAETLVGKVVRITDGDTLTVLTSGNRQYVIRLQGIDAPEHNQAFGTRSKQNLSRLVSDKEIQLDCGKQESYGRQVCKVLVNGSDACLQQVKDGFAWHYKQFESEQTREDRKLYADAEDAARAARIGLWIDPHPIPPWDFRHGSASHLCFDRDRRVACNEGYAGPVRGNVRSHKYQRPGCPYYDSVSERNRVEFPNAQAAEAAGYKAARNCP
jgi:endonuclease YncB( thermonuclease family)